MMIVVVPVGILCFLRSNKRKWRRLCAIKYNANEPMAVAVSKARIVEDIHMIPSLSKKASDKEREQLQERLP